MSENMFNPNEIVEMEKIGYWDYEKQMAQETDHLYFKDERGQSMVITLKGLTIFVEEN